MPVKDRLLTKIDKTDGGCWKLKMVGTKGYGYMSVKGKLRSTHRISYETHKGAIPEGLVIDHLCRNKACIIPEHLEAVTMRENVIRGEVPKVAGLWQKAKTHCPKGHPYDKANTYKSLNKGKYITRECRNCHKLRERIRRGKLECQKI